jgi:GNAT superfamily N-acetyltransferase
MAMDIKYLWRGQFVNQALNQLHAEGFQHRSFNDDWWTQVNHHSLGWVCAHGSNELVGFVNVAWDGAMHAFILDTVVAKTHRHQGVATEMLAICVRKAREARCEWLHVDFEDHLGGLYWDRCAFIKTNAGLIKLV